MPRTRSLAWAELKIGVVATVAVIIATFVVFQLSGVGGFFWQRYGIKTVFADVAGLKEGAPVRLAGMEVGSVTRVALTGDRVEVEMQVGREHRGRITSNSVASLGSVSLLGEAAVDITAASQGTPVPDWGYVRSGRATGTIADVTSQATVAMEQATLLVSDIRAGRGTIGKMMTDDALFRELTSLVSTAEELTRGINRGRGTLGRLVTNPAAAQALEGSLQNLQALTAKIRAGEGSLGKLLNDDAMSKSLTSTTANLDAITGRINRGEGTAGKLMNDPELYNRLNSLSDRIDKVMAGLQSGEGTAGQLLKDRQLYENINGTMAELKGLVSDIRRDPKKYLNVKVSLF